MKKLAFLFIALVTILSISACRIEKTDVSNEPAKSYTLNLCDFQSIKNYTGCDIHFTQSDTYKVVLKATPSWYASHTITSNNGELVLVQKEERKKKGITVLHINAYDDDAELWISAPSLAAVSIAGSGDFYADSNITGKGLEMSIAGSGDCKLKNVTLTGDFYYIIAGSGDIETGTIQARNASFSISGSGDIESKLAKVKTTKLTIAGSGDGTLAFDHCGYADISISGSGDVSLSGTLQSLDKSVSGAGDINTDRLKLGK
jgi:hypothetical protein